MTLIMILILAAILIVFAIYAVKRASRKAGAVDTGSKPVTTTNTSAAPNRPGGTTPVGPGDFMASTPAGSGESGRSGGVTGTDLADTPGAGTGTARPLGGTGATGAGSPPPSTHDANVPNPTGSIPDKKGTKGDGNSALSGGGQG